MRLQGATPKKRPYLSACCRRTTEHLPNTDRPKKGSGVNLDAATSPGSRASYQQVTGKREGGANQRAPALPSSPGSRGPDPLPSPGRCSGFTFWPARTPRDAGGIFTCRQWPRPGHRTQSGHMFALLPCRQITPWSPNAETTPWTGRQPEEK